MYNSKLWTYRNYINSWLSLQAAGSSCRCYRWPKLSGVATSIYITLSEDVHTIDDPPINVETMSQITLDLPRAIALRKYV